MCGVVIKVTCLHATGLLESHFEMGFQYFLGLWGSECRNVELQLHSGLKKNKLERGSKYYIVFLLFKKKKATKLGDKISNPCRQSIIHVKCDEA